MASAPYRTASSRGPGGWLRPLPFRGDLIAAGAVVLATGAALLALRMADAWRPGWIALACGAVALLLLALGWRAPVEGPAPRAYVSALLLASVAPAVLGVLALADALAAEVSDPGRLTLVGLVLAAVYGVVSVARRSAACGLVAAVAGVVALVDAVDWIASPDITVLRWPLLVALVALGAAAWALRERMPRHAQALAVVAGGAALGIAWVSAAVSGTAISLSSGAGADGETVLWSTSPGAGWELVVLAAGAALLAFAGLLRARGVAWAGAALLAAFVVLAAEAETTLLWWPVLLVAAAGALVGVGLAFRRAEGLVAAGIAVTVAAVLTDARLAGSWDSGVRFAVCALAAAAVLALAARARARDDDGWPSDALLVAVFPLAALALLDLADALGGGPGSAGTIMWSALALAVTFGAVAAVRASGALTLLAALSAVVALVAAAEWVFEPATQDGFRWLLLAAIAALAIGVVRLRDRRHAQAVALAVAAGATALALAFLLQLLAAVAGAPGAGTGWELLLLATGFGLVAFGAVDRANGPVWVGAAVLGAFAALAALAEPSVLWWPALLLALGLGVVAAGLRPTTPAPPPPDADAPPAPTTPLHRGAQSNGR